MDTHKVIVGALGGLIAAVGVDLHAWGGGEPFNWRKAISRWIGGAIGGAALALGVTTTGVM